MQLGGSCTLGKGTKQQVRDLATYTNLTVTTLVSHPDTLTCAKRVLATHLVQWRMVTVVLENVNMLLIVKCVEQPTSKYATPWTSLRHVLVY